jgi:hypothetical protein
MGDSSGFSVIEKPDVGFVACIERGVLEAQALLLFESIRLHTGSFKDYAIYALSPRAGYAISIDARRRLDDLRVHYVDTILNSECREYGSANRVAAAAYIEETHRHEILVILDSDTLFLREPGEFILAPDIDVALRPVDIKGVCTNGPQDSFDTYWQALCRCCGVAYDEIPWGETFVDRHRIKASYNGGLVVTRGDLGIMRKWANFFLRLSDKAFDRTPKPSRFGPVPAGSKLRPASMGFQPGSPIPGNLEHQPTGSAATANL